jgi:hypothetical protein
MPGVFHHQSKQCERLCPKWDFRTFHCAQLLVTAIQDKGANLVNRLSSRDRHAAFLSTRTLGCFPYAVRRDFVKISPEIRDRKTGPCFI